MTTDASAAHPVEHNPLASMPHDTPRRHQQPGPRDAAVHHLGGDVLRRACSPPTSTSGPTPPSGRRSTPRPGRPFHARRSLPVRRAGHDPADHLSSFTCQFAVWAIRRDDRTAFLRAMAVTVVLGIIFLLMQLTDYALLGQEGLTLSSGTYGTTYYTLTGFHGAHVFGGVIMLSVVLYRGMAGQFSGEALRCGRGGLAVLALRRRRLDPAVLAAVPAARQDAGDLGVDRHASAPTPAQRRLRRDHLRGHRDRLLGGPRRSAAGTGTTMPPARRCCSSSGVAMAIMAYVLVAGSSDE